MPYLSSYLKKLPAHTHCAIQPGNSLARAGQKVNMLKATILSATSHGPSPGSHYKQVSSRQSHWLMVSTELALSGSKEVLHGSRSRKPLGSSLRNTAMIRQSGWNFLSSCASIGVARLTLTMLQPPSKNGGRMTAFANGACMLPGKGSTRNLTGPYSCNPPIHPRAFLWARNINMGPKSGPHYSYIQIVCHIQYNHQNHTGP